MVSKSYHRIFTSPRGSFFLLGPRGTGKTTFLLDKYPEARRIDLLSEALYQSYLVDVGAFHDELAALPMGARVVVDEIQRLPQLLNEVHRLIEERRLTFALSGSSARKLKKAGVNLLAGRALRRVLHPFVPEELGSDFSLERCLTTGSIPIIWNAEEPEETLAAYVQAYLKEEIQAEALVRNLPGFARFLPIAALCHGQVINTSSVARDAEVARTTVEGFFSIVEDTLLGFRLPAFQARIRVREKRRPKFYFVDPGLVRGILRLRGPLSPDLRGHLFEGWVAQLLRAYDDYRGLYDSIGYWSPAGARKTEVDFVLARGSELVALEVKSTPTPGPRDFAGLKAIADHAGVTRRILVYTGGQQRRREGIDIWPVETLLAALAGGTL